MAYRLVKPHPVDVQEQVDALPIRARASFEGALARILDLPWDSRPLNYAKPTGLRVEPFDDGLGVLVFQVIEFESVQVERVLWLG